MTKMIKCDRCGKVDEPLNVIAGWSWYEVEITACGYSDGMYRHGLDLCRACKTEISSYILNWFKDGKETSQ